MKANSKFSPKAKMFITLGGVLIAFVIFNVFMRPTPSRDSDLKQNRGLASREDSEKFDADLIKSEHALARKLASNQVRGVASINKGQIELFNKLRVELLGHIYFVGANEGGKIHRIEFVPAENDKPRYTKPEELLNNYKALWSVEFADLVPEENSSVLESAYKLLGENRSEAGRAQFKFDDEGRFLSLELHPVSSSK